MKWISRAPRKPLPPNKTSRFRPTVEMLEDRLAPTASTFQSVIGLPQVQSQYPYTGAGYSVAVLDTGIDYNNTNLGGGFGAGHRVVAGYDFINNDANPMDDNGHGTLIAGIIGSSSPTLPGIAPKVNLIDLKVLDSHMNGNWTAIDSALQWVVSHRTQFNIVAVNLSLGSGNYTANPYALLESDFATLKNAGVFTAISSGNSFYTYNSQPGIAYPATSPSVVSVGATWAGNFGSNTWSSGATDYASATDQILSVTQRSSALSILAPGAWITSDGMNNTTQTMGGTSMAAAVVTGSAVLIHQAYDSTGKGALATQDNILHLMQTTGVTVVDNDAKDSNVVPTGLSFKRLNLAAAIASLGQPLPALTLAPIANQTLAVGTTIVVPLSVTSPTGSPITFTATELYLPALAYQLKQQYGFNYLGSYYPNLRNANEKWIVGTGNVWYCILPNGELRRYVNSMTETLTPANLVATLDPSYYWNAPYAGMPPTVIGVSGGKLSIRSPAYWVGTYSVIVSASDGRFTVQQAFNVTEVPANSPPVLAPIASQTMTHSQHTRTLALSATDADKDPITFSAQVLPINGQTPAVALSLQGNQLTINPALGFVGTCTVQVSATDGKATVTQTFTVTVTNTAPTLGAIANGTASHGVDTSVSLPGSDADGDALTYTAQVLPVNGQAAPISATVQGNQLTLHPTAPVVGTFTVQVTVSDGVASASTTFNLTLTNAAPTLGAITAQTMAKGQISLSVPLSVGDADGDKLTVQAVAQIPDAAAYQLNQQYKFQAPNATYYLNLWGQNEKWLLANNAWYLLLPTGKLYRWGGSVAATLQSANLIATLDSKFYVEPRLLWNANPPVPPPITFSVQGNQLTIQRPATLTGVFSIDVTVSDGFTSVKQTIVVTLN